jgi:hypothetical protein
VKRGFTAKRYVQWRRTSAVDDFGGSNAREPTLVPIKRHLLRAQLSVSSTTKPIKGTLMKKLRLIALAALVAIGISTMSAAEKGDILPPCWRLTSGYGKGIVLFGDLGRNVFDIQFNATGHIADPDKCKCLHYHGTLFGIDEPNSACGWGCVVEVPCPPASATAAANDMQNVIDYIFYEIDADLGDKLYDIYQTMENAAADGCYTVVDALAGAFSDELDSYFLQYGYATLWDPLVQDLTEYVNSRLNALNEAPFFPVINPGNIRILSRIGSGSRGRLIDVGPRITLRVGEMLSLQSMVPPKTMGNYYWQYKWKGADEGEIPSATAISILNNHVSMVSYASTSLRLSALFRNTSGQIYHDVLMVNWSDKAF